MLKISLRAYVIFFLLMTVMLIAALSHLAPSAKYSHPFTNNIIEESMTGVRAMRFDNDGSLYQVVSMKSWQHLKGHTTTEMDSPKLRVFHPDGIWEIQARKGVGFQTQKLSHLEKLILSEQVIVQQHAHHSLNNPWTLTTENLQVLPSEHIAETQDFVTINGKGMQMHAKGMRANLNSHIVEFLKEVNCSYVKSSV